jgi:putative aldouronate transport system substrate-binding protein
MRTLSRRELLRFAGLAVAGSALAACQPKVVEVTKLVTEKEVVKETVVVAGTPKVVEKEVTKVVTVAAPKEPIEISFINYGWGTAPMKDSQIQKYIEDRMGIKLRPIWVPPTELDARINVGLASGDLADMNQLPMPDSQFHYTAQQAKAIGEKLFRDLTPYLTGADFAKNYPTLARTPKKVWDYMKFNGKIWGIPRHLVPMCSTGQFLREDLFVEAGYKVPDQLPKTLDELTEVILKLTQKGKVYGYQVHAPSMVGGGQEIYCPNGITGRGAWAADAEGNFTFQNFQPEFKEYLAWFKKLYDAGAVNPEFVTEQNRSDFNDGKSAVATHRYWAYAVPSFFSAQAPKTAKIRVLQPVKGPKAWAINVDPGFWTETVVFHLVKDDKLAAILKFSDWIASDEYRTLTMWGLKGVHYEEKDGKKVQTDKYNEEGVGAWGWFGAYNGSSTHQYWADSTKESAENWIDPDTKKPRLSEAEIKEIYDTMVSVGKALEKAQNESPTIDIPQFILVSPTYGSKWGELTAKLVDNRVKVATGNMSLKDWDAYVAEITASETYKKIAQEFKEAYRASK